jgi:glutamine---fructose-6-phosphate transaminase (isomerizing)
VDFVLSTMAGHIFGYEAALAIDAQGRLMRSARAVLDDATAIPRDDDELLMTVRANLAPISSAIFHELHSGALNGHLEPNTAVQVASLLRYATGVLPLDALEVETGRSMSPPQMIAELNAALSRAVDELTRPIDAVKHQAKTVTVGTSRLEDSFASSVLVNETVSTGTQRDRLSYRSMRTLAALDPAIEEVVGFTRYQIDGEVGDGDATIRVIDRGGIARGIESRADRDPRLTGTKHRAAFERLVTVGRGQRDGRSVVLIPETKDLQVTGITLLHVRFKELLPAPAARDVLTGYRNRYSAIVDAVTETESDFDDALLATIPLVDLLVEPVWVLAKFWRTGVDA